MVFRFIRYKFQRFSLPLSPINPNIMQNETQTDIQTEIQPNIQPETNTTKCLNCGTEFEGKYCPECGQKADTSRFTMKFISQNLLTAILSNDGGVWLTLKSLFTRPSAMVVDILNGKRKRYFSPFPMLFFALTVYILLFTFTGSRQSIQGLESLSAEDTEIAKSDTTVFSSDLERKESVKEEIANRVIWYIGTAIKFYNNHYTAVFMLTLPILLLATRAWYGKSNRRRYYKAEYLVAIVYAMVMVVLFRCLVSLVYLFSERASDVINNFFMVVIVAAFTACFQKMLGFSIAKTAWRSLLAIVLYYIILGALLLSVLLILIFFVFFVVKRQQG